MIDFENFQEAEAHDYYELIRMLYPKFVSEEKLKLINKGSSVVFVGGGRTLSLNLEKGLDKEQRRRRIKTFILKDLNYPGKIPSAFGILTGVRPVKLVLELLETMSLSDLKDYLKKNYSIEDKMIDFLLSIGQKERAYFSTVDPFGYSVYLHIPFCPSRCAYCSYPMIKSSNRESLDSYVETLLLELDTYKDLKVPPTSIYIGGGTPTSIGEKYLRRILSKVQKIFHSQCEFTVEAGRPDTLNDSIFSALKDYGVNRISINPQTMHDKTLKILNRQHSVTDFLQAYNLGKKYDFNINVDLILGLPQENRQDILDSLNQVIALDPDNITIHTLSLKNGSQLFQQGEYFNTSFIVSEVIQEVYTILKSLDYAPYYMYRQKRTLGNGFNAGYSKPKKESIYNMLMMDEGQSILGFGMSSSTKFYDPKTNRIEKILQYKNLKDYLNHWNDKNAKKSQLREDFKW